MKQAHPNIGMIFIEDKANGSAIVNVLNQEMTGICPVNPKGGKESRVQAVLPYIKANMKLPKYKEFVSDTLDEWYSFPNGTHDDDVDAMSQALSEMMFYYGEVPTTKKRSITDEFFGITQDDEDTLCGDI